MDQSLIEELVAAATGETIREVRSRGFHLADPLEVRYDPEPVSDQVVSVLRKKTYVIRACCASLDGQQVGLE